MRVDIIILSDSKNEELMALTQQTVNSCIDSESGNDIEFNIVVIEQNSAVTHTNCITRHEAQPFNYNKFMNIGVSMFDAEYVCLCNNDLIFQKNWCSILIDAMQKNDLLSACPLCPEATKEMTQPIHFGYRNSHEMSGWCIMTNRKLYNIIGKIDESFPFWFADNIYAEQLKRFGVKHAIITGSKVLHIRSKTLNTLAPDKKNDLSIKHIRDFINKHPNNESAIYFNSKNRHDK
jgi:GT2 family glycosyltransferase